MKIRITFWQRILLAIAAFTVATVCFMVRLPAAFSHADKELHTLFYFLAASFLNILFAKRNMLIHAFIFGFLYAFGVGIEYAQQYSNTYLHKKIHGNFDPEDVHANLQGLIYFSVFWLCYVAVMFLWNIVKRKTPADNAASVKE